MPADKYCEADFNNARERYLLLLDEAEALSQSRYGRKLDMSLLDQAIDNTRRFLCRQLTLKSVEDRALQGGPRGAQAAPPRAERVRFVLGGR